MQQDPDVLRDFRKLRTILNILTVALVLLWLLFTGWVFYRISIRTYTIDDAAADRVVLCEYIESLQGTPDNIIARCPPVKGAD